MVSVEGLEHKYNLELSRGTLVCGLTLPYVKVVPFYSFISFVFVSLEWKVLKNRKFLGSLSTQDIRTKSKAVIQELHSQYVSVTELTTERNNEGHLENLFQASLERE